MKNIIIKGLLVIIAMGYLYTREEAPLNGVDLLAVEVIGLIGFDYLKLKLW